MQECRGALPLCRSPEAGPLVVVSVFNLFSIGVGPSSHSHTVGPMRAARRFMLDAQGKGALAEAYRVKTDLYGSLALTGHGHATDIAVILGLEGMTPEGIRSQFDTRAN